MWRRWVGVAVSHPNGERRQAATYFGLEPREVEDRDPESGVRPWKWDQLHRKMV